MAAVNYLWNPLNDNIAREFDDAGATAAEYTTEPEQFGNVVSQCRNGQTSYLHFDGQGNTTELTNDAGTATDTIRYSAFGEVTERTGNTEIPFQYVGQKGYYRDELTGDYWVRRRVLSTKLGRWISVDPLESMERCLALFEYTGNRPTAFIDPSGNAWYGNWCGPGGGPAPPADAVDSCCFAHDACYKTCGTGGPWGVLAPNSCARGCDRTFCLCLLTAVCTPWWNYGCNKFRELAACTFCARGSSLF